MDMSLYSKAMLKTIVMMGVLVFLVQAQVPASKAERAWPSFWSAFKLAIFSVKQTNNFLFF